MSQPLPKKREVKDKRKNSVKVEDVSIPIENEEVVLTPLDYMNSMYFIMNSRLRQHVYDKSGELLHSVDFFVTEKPVKVPGVALFNIFFGQ